MPGNSGLQLMNVAKLAVPAAPTRWTDEALYGFVRDSVVVSAPTPDVAAFIDHFRATHGRLLGVVFYGSRVSTSGHASTSLYDFFLFTDDARAFFSKQRSRDVALAKVLAPSTYTAKVGEARCKYNVVTLADFEHECGAEARDLFHAGRFSKRVQLVWTRDVTAERALVHALVNAARTVVPMALSRLPAEFTFDEYLLGVLGLSYAAEIRVESDSKVERLLAAEREHYEALYGQLLARQEEAGVVVRGLSPQRWHQDVTTLPARRAATEALLARSRRRMYARWFKYMMTLDGWVDLMLEKVERTKGIRIEMSPLERKYAYIFGWKYFYRFLRRGLVK